MLTRPQRDGRSAAHRSHRQRLATSPVRPLGKQLRAPARPVDVSTKVKDQYDTIRRRQGIVKAVLRWLSRRAASSAKGRQSSNTRLTRGQELPRGAGPRLLRREPAAHPLRRAGKLLPFRSSKRYYAPDEECRTRPLAGARRGCNDVPPPSHRSRHGRTVRSEESEEAPGGRPVQAPRIGARYRLAPDQAR
jgi:hypothetical protein